MAKKVLVLAPHPDHRAPALASHGAFSFSQLPGLVPELDAGFAGNAQKTKGENQ